MAVAGENHFPAVCADILADLFARIGFCAVAAGHGPGIDFEWLSCFQQGVRRSLPCLHIPGMMYVKGRTLFNKLRDPLADKLLVCSALICLVELGRIPAWATIIIIAREFVISGIRLVAVDDGVVISASKWGKYKTVFQMIMVGFMIGNLPIFDLLTTILMWIALALTIISLIDYIMKNISIFKKFGDE